MMKMHTNDMPIVNETLGTTVRGKTWDEMTCTIMQFPAGTDLTPALKGLPHDMCQVPHWGYVLHGTLNVRYVDGTEEAITPGELYYLPVGHTVWFTEDTTFVEFSPAQGMHNVLEHAAAAMAQS
jgi:hypothetical protein